jgi:pyridoxine/pyridoxamine 5'-phosphate oxidase
MVLLKQVDEDGFVFFTNYHSAKARNSRAILRGARVLLDHARSPGARLKEG